MATIKFSGFTNEAVDAADTQLVGYKVGDATANYRYSIAQLATALSSSIPTIYSADGDIIVNRTINDRAGGFATDAGNGVLKMNVRNSGAFQIAGYLNNGDPGTANNCVRWGAGTTLGGMNVKGNLGLTSGGGNISLIASGGSQFLTMNQNGSAIDTKVSIGAATVGTEMLEVDGNCKITGQGYTEQHDQTGVTIDWDNSNVVYATLVSGSQTFTPTNPKSGATYILYLRQPGAGAAGTVDWNSLALWSGGTAPTLTATNGATDVITLIYNGTSTKYFGTSVLNFS